MNLFHMKKSLLAFALGFSAFSFGQMTMNGSASMLVPGTCDCYRLTTNAAAVRGAIWSPGMIDLTQSFDMTFDIYAGNPSDEFYAGDGWFLYFSKTQRVLAILRMRLVIKTMRP
jgi:hypothetical protein